MSRWRRESVVIGIGASSLVSMPARPVGSEARAAQLGVRVRDYRTEDPQTTNSSDLAPALVSAMAGLSLPSASAVQVMVADGLARHWVVDPPAGLQSLAELQAVARARAEQTFGPMAGWVVEADWQLGRPFLCCALPAWLIDGLRRGLRRPVPLETTLSALLSGLRRATAASGEEVWEGFWTPGLFTWVAWQAGRLRWLHSIRLTEAPQGGKSLLSGALEQALATLQGDSVRSDLDVQASVGVLALHPGIAQLPTFQSVPLGETHCVVSQPPAWAALIEALKLTATPAQQDAWVAACLPVVQVQRMADHTRGVRLAQFTPGAST